MSPTHKQNVLRAYRELIDLIHRMPAAEKAKALAEARSTVKARKAEASALAATDMLREMYEQISFLRVVTPRSPRDRRHIVGSSTYVVRDGELVEGIGNVKGKRVADGTIPMNEAWDLHNRLMRRQYLGQEPPKAPEPFF